MSKKIIILGAGAAPGVPSLSMGWQDCNPDNPKNKRLRTSVYYEIDGSKILLDTSPDLRLQLIENNIRKLDGVLYTHVHADHLHGIDDLREINRISLNSLNIYGTSEVLNVIRQRFSYLIAEPDHPKDCIRQPSLVANEVNHNEPFFIGKAKITPIKLLGHNAPTTGYVFNDGEIVHIADFRAIDNSGWAQIKRRPKMLVIPLTTPYAQRFHAGLDEVLACIEKINPEQAIINHMASECDYDAVDRQTPDNVTPAYDNMTVYLQDEKED